MSEITLHHNDCQNFCSLDVAKGVCRRKGELTLIDLDTCDSYRQLPKCKFCAHYAGNGNQMGVCKAETSEPWAYAEMIAVTCEMFLPA